MNAMSPHFRDGRAYPTPAQINAAIDELAELLSQGLTLNDASDRMEVSRGTGCVVFRELCLRYGERPH